MAPAVAVFKLASPTTVKEGGVGSQTVTYTYTVTNSSPAGAVDPLGSVVLSDDNATPGKSGWFAGVLTDGRKFVVYVEDNGEPGKNDIFRLWIEGVEVTPAHGGLTGGNIQIHQ